MQNSNNKIINIKNLPNQALNIIEIGPIDFFCYKCINNGCIQNQIQNQIDEQPSEFDRRHGQSYN